MHNLIFQFRIYMYAYTYMFGVDVMHGSIVCVDSLPDNLVSKIGVPPLPTDPVQTPIRPR